LLLITLVLALLARAQDDHSTPAPMLDIADAIIIKKAARTLTLLKGGRRSRPIPSHLDSSRADTSSKRATGAHPKAATAFLGATREASFTCRCAFLTPIALTVSAPPNVASRQVATS